MKRKHLAIVGLALLSSCRDERDICTPAPVNTYPGFVPIDTANKMISSYINSIDYQVNDTDLRSVIVSAAELRYYLDSLPNSSTIKNIEIKFAHKLSYINTGNKDQPAGFDTSALTMILVGLNSSGAYVYADNNVINRVTPCPPSCPSSGPMLTNDTATK